MMAATVIAIVVALVAFIVGVAVGIWLEHWNQAYADYVPKNNRLGRQPDSRVKSYEGLVAFLMENALENPRSFMSLLGRVIPLQMNVKSDSSVRVEYKSGAEYAAAMRERGIDARFMNELLLIEGQKFLPPPKDRRKKESER